MMMYIVLLRNVEKLQDTFIQKPYDLLANTGIDSQYIYQEAIVEGRSVPLVGERMMCSNIYFEGFCSKVSKSDY